MLDDLEIDSRELTPELLDILSIEDFYSTKDYGRERGENLTSVKILSITPHVIIIIHRLASSSI